MPVPENEALIDLEDMLANPMVRAWNRVWAKQAKKVKAAIKKGDWDRAHDIIDLIDYAPIAKKNLKLAETVGNASLLLGASRIVKKGTTEGGSRQEVLEHMLNQFETVLSDNATAQIKLTGHRHIERIRRLAGEERGIVVKAGNPVIVGLGPIGSLGEGFAHLASNIHTSRLNSFGFLATALEQQITHYQVSEVMDNRTCPVCREMDGRVFTVQQGAQHAMSIMNNDDPDMIQHIAPWPSQSRGSVSNLRDMSSNDMASRGLSLPPYHPSCRGIVSTTTSRSTTAAPQGIPAASTFQEARPAARALLEQAKGAEKAITKDMKLLMKGDSTVHLEGLPNKFKKQRSLTKKVHKAAKAGNITPAQAVGEINDTLRYTVVADEGTYAKTVDRVTKAMERKGYTHKGTRNTWAKPGQAPGPYQGVNMNFVNKEGFTFEIQFHTEASFKMKNVTNQKLYKLLDKATPTRKIELARAMSENQKLVPRPQNAQLITNRGVLPSKVENVALKPKPPLKPPADTPPWKAFQSKVDDAFANSNTIDEFYTAVGEEWGVWHRDPEIAARMQRAFGMVRKSDNPELFRALINSSKSVEVRKGVGGKLSHYQSWDGTISMAPSKFPVKGPRSKWTFRHEFGHHMDADLSTLEDSLERYMSHARLKSRGTLASTTDDLLAARKGAGREAFDNWTPRSWDDQMAYMTEQFQKAGITTTPEVTMVGEHMRIATAIDTGDMSYYVESLFGPHAPYVSDYYGSTTLNKVGRGHSLRYYKEAVDNQATEAFANYVATRAVGTDYIHYELMRFTTPDMMAQFDWMITQLAKGGP